MQTLTNSALEFRHDDTEVTIYRDGQNVGRIAYSFEFMRWEYAPMGKAVRATGSLEQCCDAATDELMPKPNPEPVVEVVKVHQATSKPTYKAQGWGNWKQHGAGNSTQVTVKGDHGEFDLWIPATFAAKVRVGSSYIHRHDSVTHQDFLAWPSRPVRRRSAISAA
ncbi:MAG: hypothetical protein AAF959_11820 [Cyanobacteria bacterium P01_D01_bin.56]